MALTDFLPQVTENAGRRKDSVASLVAVATAYDALGATDELPYLQAMAANQAYNNLPLADQQARALELFAQLP